MWFYAFVVGFFLLLENARFGCGMSCFFFFYEGFTWFLASRDCERSC